MAPTLLNTGHGMGYQRTIRRQVSVEGIGLHSGEPVKLTLSPAAADTGILFRAADGTLIPADIEHVVDGRAATTLGAFGVRIRTIEHLMAAAAALGIDNFVADVSAGKNTRFGKDERYNLRFRWEAFNFFNRANYNQPAAEVNVASPAFGSITSAARAREMQLGIRLEF